MPANAASASPSDHSSTPRGISGRRRHHTSAPAAATTSTAPIHSGVPCATSPSEPTTHTSHVTSSSPSGFAKATPRPGRRAKTTAASGVAASPSTSISTKKRSAAVIACARH